MPQRIPPEAPDLMTPREAAALFDVNSNRLAHWARAGKLTFERTLGGHRRYHKASVEALLNSDQRAEVSA